MTKEQAIEAGPLELAHTKPIGTVEVVFLQRDTFPIYSGDKTPGQMVDAHLEDVTIPIASITVRFVQDD